jgi:hypothetical protein
MSNEGISKLANTLTGRMRKENESPLVLDFGEVLENYSLMTNTFPVPIPKSDYTICRGLTFGNIGEKLGETNEPSQNLGEIHTHSVLVPIKMRSVKSGDRVLVAWVQNEAVVVDIITSARNL